MNPEFHLPRMSFKVIFSVSVLSLALSHFSNSLFLADELSVSFSSSFSFINQLLSRFSSNPNYVFLFCNGILVLIITNSGHFPGSHPPEKPAGSSSLQLHPEGSSVPEVEEEDQQERAGQGERVISGAHHDHQHPKEDEQEEEEEDMEMVVSGGGDHHDKGGGGGGEEGLSDEEWDKKFDEFIKKMKQDFIMLNK